MKKLFTNFYLLLICFTISFYFSGCKKDDNVYRSSFTLNGDGQRFYTPVAYLKVEGYDSKAKIYYLSLTFPTSGVLMDTNRKSLIGYGEAVQLYFFSTTKTEVPEGKYSYSNPLDTSNLLSQIHKIYTYSNNYSFTYTQNQNGYIYKTTKGGVLNVSKIGDIYDITYGVTMTKKNLNLIDIDSWYLGDYKGEIVFP
jgi:hypothetical protein